MTTTRSASVIASSIEWVMKTTVWPVLETMRSSSLCIASRVMASMAAKGSSASRMSGSETSARAMPTRCFMPPESS